MRPKKRRNAGSNTPIAMLVPDDGAPLCSRAANKAYVRPNRTRNTNRSPIASIWSGGKENEKSGLKKDTVLKLPRKDSDEEVVIESPKRQGIENGGTICLTYSRKRLKNDLVEISRASTRSGENDSLVHCRTRTAEPAGHSNAGASTSEGNDHQRVKLDRSRREVPDQLTELSPMEAHDNLKFSPAGSEIVELQRDLEMTAVLKKAYDKLYKKYRHVKTRKLEDVDALFQEQTRRIEAYSKAAEALVEELKSENSHLRGQIEEADIKEILHRSRLLEEEVVDCQNDLVLERCKSFELQLELSKARARISELESSAPTAAMGTIPCACRCNGLEKVPQDSTSLGARKGRTGLFNHDAHKPIGSDVGHVQPAEAFDSSQDIVDSRLKDSQIPAQAKDESLVCSEDQRIVMHITTNELAVEDLLVCPKDLQDPVGRQKPRSEDFQCSQRPQDSTDLLLLHDSTENETDANCSKVTKILVQLLESLTYCSLVIDTHGQSPQLMFTHDASGFSFKLEQNEVSEEGGGKDALLYYSISHGTLAQIAPEWMRSVIVFDMAQVQNFFQRFWKVACG